VFLYFIIFKILVSTFLIYMNCMIYKYYNFNITLKHMYELIRMNNISFDIFFITCYININHYINKNIMINILI